VGAGGRLESQLRGQQPLKERAVAAQALDTKARHAKFLQ
jgi:hypothetical protein